MFLNDSEHLQNSRLINVSGDSLDLFIRYYDIITSSADSAFKKLWLLPSTVIHTTPGLVRPTRSSCRQTNTWVVGVLNNFFRVQPIHLPLTCRHTMSPPTSPGCVCGSQSLVVFPSDIIMSSVACRRFLAYDNSRHLPHQLVTKKISIYL